jgi:thioredoxin reductase
MEYDTIIIGGSYAGLAAAMSLGRAMRKVLIIDGGKPCNRYASESHNFIGHDGESPSQIRDKAREQVLKYPTVKFIQGFVSTVTKTEQGYAVETQDTKYAAKTLLLATGVVDQLPSTPGFEECWGKTIIACPYCHGYEVRDRPTAVIAKTDIDFDYVAMVINWSKQLTVLTEGQASMSEEKLNAIKKNGLTVIDKKIKEYVHKEGHLSSIVFEDDSSIDVQVLYTHPHTQFANDIPKQLDLKLNPMGLIQIDFFNKTSALGVYAAGDCTTFLRTVSNSVGDGNKAGAMLNRELCIQNFSKL